MVSLSLSVSTFVTGDIDALSEERKRENWEFEFYGNVFGLRFWKVFVNL